MTSLYSFALKQVKGLPSVGLKASDRQMRNVANPRLGATMSTLPQSSAPLATEVIGQPSMKVQRAAQGVVTTLRRRSQWADFITDDELKAFEKIAEQVLAEARSLSRGTLSTRDLARRGNPYGRGQSTPQGVRRRGVGRLQGSRAGVSNMAVVNRQSGDFADGWSVNVSRDKGGVTMELANTVAHSVYLLGTSKMKAHGPFSTAVARNLPSINREWARLTRRAQARAAQLEAL